MVGYISITALILTIVFLTIGFIGLGFYINNNIRKINNDWWVYTLMVIGFVIGGLSAIVFIIDLFRSRPDIEKRYEVVRVDPNYGQYFQ